MTDFIEDLYLPLQSVFGAKIRQMYTLYPITTKQLKLPKKVYNSFS